MFDHYEVYDACQGKPPPPVLIPPRQREGGEIQPSKHCAKKRCADVTSVISPLEIEGVKDGDGQANLASCFLKLKWENGGKG